MFSGPTCQEIIEAESLMLQALAGESSQIQDNFRKEFSEIENSGRGQKVGKRKIFYKSLAYA